MPPRRLLVGREAEVAEAYRSGETVEQLAERHDCSTTSIRSLLQQQGVEARARGPRSPLEGRERQVAADYEAGATVRELSETYGANGRTIRKALIEQGVTMRARGPRSSA